MARATPAGVRHLVAASVLAAACAGRIEELADDAGAATDAPPGAVDATPPPPEPGLRAAYYHRYGRLALDRVDPAVDFLWGDGAPSAELAADRFSIRWAGELDVPAAGSYRFIVTADDGVRLWIGGALVIDDWTPHWPARFEATVDLAAGPTALRLEYFEVDLNAEAHLAWSGPGFAEEIIPAARLRAAPPGDAAPAPKPPYQNPVVPFDCPDPGVAAAGEPLAFFMVCTGGSFPIRRSDDLVLWDDAGAAVLPGGKPAWAANGFRNWAPELHRIGDRWIAYYTTVNGADVLSIGAAWATEPLGPYTDRGGPLVEHPDGVIDATYFRDDDGRSWLFYKIDGNAHGRPTPIFARELAADGLDFAPGSAPVQVLSNDSATWEGGVVEAPWVVRRDGRYYLFYSGNVYDHRYRTGVARADQLLGPYEKRGAPLLANNERWVGPGHGSVVRVADRDWFVYHAWPATPAGTHDAAAGRHVLVDAIDWIDGWPSLGDGTPSRTLRPWPIP